MDSAGMLSLYYLATVMGAISTGYLVDRYHISVALTILSLGAAVSVFFAWGFATNFGSLCAFAFFYGIFAGGWSSTWIGIAKEIKKQSPNSELSVMLGFTIAARGIGSIVSGPISETLISNGAEKTIGWPGSYGTSYGVLILFTGVALSLGGVSSMVRVCEAFKRHAN